MKVLVFGKSGQVAQALADQDQDGLHLTFLDRGAADLTQPKACVDAIRTIPSDVVINAAAYTAVDQAEENEALAMQVNATTPGAMARECALLDRPFLHLSTDYIFDGSGKTPHAPNDPTGPLNVYGKSKRAGEQAVLAAKGRAAILRTSWVFSIHGSNFVKTMLELARSHTQLNIVDDQVGGPTPADDIARVLVTMAQRLHHGHQGGVYHFSGAPAVSWADFAREIFRQTAHGIEVKDIPTRDFPTSARRPLNSRLDCQSLLRDFGCEPADWKTGLGHVLNALKQGDK